MKKIFKIAALGVIFSTFVAPLTFASTSSLMGSDKVHRTIIHTMNSKTLNNVAVTLYAGQGLSGNSCTDIVNVGASNLAKVEDGMSIDIGSLIPAGYQCMSVIFEHNGKLGIDVFALKEKDDKSGYDFSYPELGNVTLK